MCVWSCGHFEGIEREKILKKYRQIDIQIKRQTDRKRDRQTDKQTDRYRDRQTEIYNESKQINKGKKKKYKDRIER